MVSITAIPPFGTSYIVEKLIIYQTFFNFFFFDIKKAEVCHFTVDTMRGKLCILCTLLFCAFSVW